MAEVATTTTYPHALDLLPEILPPDDDGPGTLEDDPSCEHDVVHDRSHAILNVLQGIVGVLEAGEDPAPGLQRLRALEAPVPLGFAASDESTPLATGAELLTFHLPRPFRLDHVFVELKVPQASGTLATVDLKAGGVSIFSTRPTIDNTQETSLVAAVPAVLAETQFPAGTKFVVSLDAIAAGTAAKGLKVWLVGWWQ